ncbi:hypothetical protein PV341_15410 [Streptomyces sp. PA03-1a]|nr:hypothetical protein [Streptomyces sp. PA03-1a]
MLPAEPPTPQPTADLLERGLRSRPAPAPAEAPAEPADASAAQHAGADADVVGEYEPL